MVRSGPQAPGSTDIKRRALSLPTLISLALAAAFLVFLITRFDVDLGDTWNKVKGSDPWLLAAAVLVHYTTFVFRGARWRVLLQNAQEDGAPVPGVLYCAQLVLLGWFANAIAWLRLGDAYRAFLYREEQGVSFSRTIGTVLAERVLDGVLIVLLLAAAVPFLVASNGDAAWYVLAVAAALVGLLAGVVAVMIWARDWVLRRLPEWLAERYRQFHQGTVGSFQHVPQVTVWGLLAWMSEVGRLFLVAQALDLDIGFPVVIALVVANSLLSLVPTPGGFGAVEPGVAGLAVRLSNLTSGMSFALVLVDRGITYVSVIIVGGLLFVGRQAVRRRPASVESSPVAPVEHH